MTNPLSRPTGLATLAVLCSLMVTASARAATLTVTKTADTDDGVCNADCSLREAINTGASGDTIVFSALFNTPQTITLTLATPLEVSEELVIVGPGAQLLTVAAVGGASPPNVFRVTPGVYRDVAISGMTITGGRFGIENVTADLVVERCVIIGNSSGGVFNWAITDVIGSTVTGNTGQRGGGVENRYFLGISSSTISNNISTDVSGDAGGVYHTTDNGVLVISNSTISGNTGSVAGGVFADGDTIIMNSTITNNSGSQAGGLFAVNPTVSVASTIVAANVNNAITPDVKELNAALVSAGYNLIGNIGAVTAFSNLGDQTGTAAAVLDPLLLPLADNGGETMTHRLRGISPAIDKGSSQGATVDQRGYLRPYDQTGIAAAAGGDHSDIGAYEAQLVVGVIGWVHDIRGAILTGVRITMTALPAGASRSGRTNLKGRFVLSKVPTNMKYLATATMDGYRFASQVITVGEEAITNVVFVGTPVRP